jgi:hypothetical protein
MSLYNNSVFELSALCKDRFYITEIAAQKIRCLVVHLNCISLWSWSCGFILGMIRINLISLLSCPVILLLNFW